MPDERDKVMPDCPNCGTWNPDDKVVCWRCQAELPKPKPAKKPTRRIAGLSIWVWVILILFFVVWILGQCFVLSPASLGM